MIEAIAIIYLAVYQNINHKVEKSELRNQNSYFEKILHSRINFANFDHSR